MVLRDTSSPTSYSTPLRARDMLSANTHYEHLTCDYCKQHLGVLGHLMEVEDMLLCVACVVRHGFMEHAK